MWSKIKGLFKRGGGTPTSITRQIQDISIEVSEGLSDTRQITIKAWSPEIARALFWEIHCGLAKPEHADAFHAAALIAVRRLLEAAKNEAMP